MTDDIDALLDKMASQQYKCPNCGNIDPDHFSVVHPEWCTRDVIDVLLDGSIRLGDISEYCEPPAQEPDPRNQWWIFCFASGHSNDPCSVTKIDYKHILWG